MIDKEMRELEFLRKAYKEKSDLLKTMLEAYDLLLWQYRRMVCNHPNEAYQNAFVVLHMKVHG